MKKWIGHKFESSITFSLILQKFYLSKEIGLLSVNVARKSLLWCNYIISPYSCFLSSFSSLFRKHSTHSFTMPTYFPHGQIVGAQKMFAVDGDNNSYDELGIFSAHNQ